MVEVTVDIAADAAVHDEIVSWINRFPQTAELNLRHADSIVTATLHSPPQLATLVMAVAMFLRTKPAEQRPTVTVTAPNGESLEVTTKPDPNEIRSGYIAMDRQPPPVAPAITAGGADTIDAEIIDEAEPAAEPEPGSAASGRALLHQNSTRSVIDD